MSRTVALLRAVNITTRPVKMERLRTLFAEMGLANVSTYIASGNVLFDGDEPHAALEERIEAHLAGALGFEVATFLRSPGEMAVIAAHEPFAAADRDTAFGLMVAFLKARPDEAATAARSTGCAARSNRIPTSAGPGWSGQWGCRRRCAASPRSAN